MSALAKRLLELDRKYPGDPESNMDLSAKLWAELVELARSEVESGRRASRTGCHRCEAVRELEKLKEVNGYLYCRDERGCTRRDRARGAPEKTAFPVLRDILLLVGRRLPRATFSAWTAEQRDEAEKWASLSHLAASDNPVKVPPMPACVKRLAEVRR